MPKFNTNAILSKVVDYTDRLAGHSARKYENLAGSLKDANKMGVKGIPESAKIRANRLTEVAKGRSFQTRLKTGVGVVAGGTAGFLGIHKYHQHNDNKIMERIDLMYRKE
jgi:hypothetical protein